MTTLKRLVAATPIVAVALSASACSETSSGSPTTTSATSSSSQMRVDSSIAQEYSSLGDLAKASSDVVVGTVVGQPQRTAGSEDNADPSAVATVVDFRITRTISGAHQAGEVIKIRQFGTPESPAGEDGQISYLSPSSNEYTLYVQPFVYDRGVSTGQYQIVGEVGAFKMTSESSGVRTTTQGKIPKAASLNSIEASARGLRSGSK